MTTVHNQGPLVVFGQAGNDYNPQLGPSLLWGGAGLFDPRAGYQPGQQSTVPILGWCGGDAPLINQVPSAISAVNIAALQVPVAATPLTLVSATGAGITAGASVVNLATGQLVTGLLAIDGATGLIAFGADATINAYDPRTLIARTVRITSVGNDSAATATIRGFDIYGQPMSETQTLTNASVTAGKKAFKYITSITPAGTLSGSNVSVGTGDIFGFPMRVDEWPFANINYGTPPAPLITSSTGFTAADNSAVTATTGDVRGTYAVQSSSDGTKKLYVTAMIQPWNLAPVGGVYTGLFGLVNFTN